MFGNNPNLDLAIINAYIKFDELLSIIVQKNWAETKFWHQSRAISLLQMSKKWILDA